MTAQNSVGPVLVCNSSECVGFDCHGFTGIERTVEWPERDKPPTAGNEDGAAGCNESKFTEAGESNPIIPTENTVPEASRSSSELAAAIPADSLPSGKPSSEGADDARNHRVTGNAIPVVEASDTPQATEKKADSEGVPQDSESTQRSSSSADEQVNYGAETPKVLPEGLSSSAPPVPIQGQFEKLLHDSDTRSSDVERTSDVTLPIQGQLEKLLHDSDTRSSDVERTSDVTRPNQGQFEKLLHDSDTRSSDVERTSDVTSQSVSSAQTSNGSNNSNLSSNSDASNNSVCSQVNTPAATTPAAGSAESAPPKKVRAGPEGSDEEPGAPSAISNDVSSAGSGSASPVQPSPSKKITWGKAKAYPGSETVSELEDERSVETSEMRSMRRRQAVRVPVRPRTPSIPRHFRGPRGKGRGLKRNGPRKAPGREE